MEMLYRLSYVGICPKGAYTLTQPVGPPTVIVFDLRSEMQCISRRCCVGFEDKSLAAPVFSAEWEGFEPSVPVTQYNSLANYRIRPLCHHS